MLKKSKSLLAVFLVFMLFIQSAIVMNVSAVEEDIYKKMVSIANNEVGYVETTYSDGTFSSKYGEWYGIPKGAWCAMFVSWCANQAGISTESIPKFASCSVGIQWFKNKGLWREKSGYTPSVGDIVFLHQGTHVGIVDSFKNGVLGTVEGNASDENGENFAVRKKFYSSSSSDITGYGIPDKTIMSKINGKAIQKQTAYMLPNASSQTVWEIWKDDDLQVICKDGSYYLVMYPFLSTGKFVCAYVPVSTVSTSADIPNATNFYLNQKATVKANSDIYHNPSDSSLLSRSITAPSKSGSNLFTRPFSVSTAFTAASEHMNISLSDGNLGSSGIYAAPAFMMARGYIIIYSDLSIRTPTMSSGQTPVSDTRYAARSSVILSISP